MLYSDTRNLLINLKMLFDSTFLRDGHYTNVAQGDIVAGTDVSLLIKDTTESGMSVWQSPYQEWVYESGITLNDAPFISGLPQPTRATGVYINGVYTEQSAGISGLNFYIDYINGRVIFDSDIPDDSVIQADYAYRHFRMDIFNKYTIPDIQYYTDHELKDNPWSNGNVEYPTGAERVGAIPAVFIEVGESDNQVYELGNRSRIKTQMMDCHVYTQNDAERDVAMDLLDSRWHIHMPFIDFNYAPLPLSGILNTVSPDYIPYQTLLEIQL